MGDSGFRQKCTSAIPICAWAAQPRFQPYKEAVGSDRALQSHSTLCSARCTHYLVSRGAVQCLQLLGCSVDLLPTLTSMLRGKGETAKERKSRARAKTGSPCLPTTPGNQQSRTNPEMVGCRKSTTIYCGAVKYFTVQYRVQ
jgi:hypothetical protein